MGEYLHFDPVNLAVVIAGIIAFWVTLRKDSDWHGSWIKKHDAECDQQRQINNRILTELQKTNEHLITLTESHGGRIDRIENQMDRAR